MNDKNKEFFVGYLAMPEGLKPFYKGLAAALMLLAAGFALWVASSQQSAGEGQWLLAEEKTYQGYLSHQPYPVLHISGEKSLQKVHTPFFRKR